MRLIADSLAARVMELIEAREYADVVRLLTAYGIATDKQGVHETAAERYERTATALSESDAELIIRVFDRTIREAGLTREIAPGTTVDRLFANNLRREIGGDEPPSSVTPVTSSSTRRRPRKQAVSAPDKTGDAQVHDQNGKQLDGQTGIEDLLPPPAGDEDPPASADPPATVDPGLDCPPVRRRPRLKSRTGDAGNLR